MRITIINGHTEFDKLFSIYLLRKLLSTKTWIILLAKLKGGT